MVLRRSTVAPPVATPHQSTELVRRPSRGVTSTDRSVDSFRIVSNGRMAIATDQDDRRKRRVKQLKGRRGGGWWRHRSADHAAHSTTVESSRLLSVSLHVSADPSKKSNSGGLTDAGSSARPAVNGLLTRTSQCTMQVMTNVGWQSAAMVMVRSSATCWSSSLVFSCFAGEKRKRKRKPRRHWPVPVSPIGAGNVICKLSIGKQNR